MKDANRDLLVMSKLSLLSQEELDRQVGLLNRLLYHVESWDNFCIAHEVLDINRLRIIRKPYLLEKVVLAKEETPFVFVSNKN